MGNHYHLIIETLDGNLSKGMRQLNGVYTQASNRRHGRSGHLFQGRYKAILVDKDRYLLELSRYVVLNPLRAKGMVKRLEDWPWSSYPAMVGSAPKSEWLTTDWILSLFGKQRIIATERYRQFVLEGVQHQPEIWSNLKGQIYLGDKAFVAEMQKRIGKEKDDLNIPSSKSGRLQSLCPRLQHKPKTAKQRSLPPTKPVHTANEKSVSSINCTQRRLGLLFARIRILDSGPDTFFACSVN